MTFNCPSCEAEIAVVAGGRPNVRSQVLAHVSTCLGSLPPTAQVDQLTELAMRSIELPPEHCRKCDDICTIHGEDDNVAFCSDLSD